MILNVLVPLAGNRTFKTGSDSAFPKILNEVNGKLLLEKAAAPILELPYELNIMVLVPKPEIKQYNLDDVLTSLDRRIKVIGIDGETAGATCTALLSVEYLELGSPIIITSFEQILDLKLKPNIEHFLNSQADCGVLTFDSIHPRFSYVLTDEQGNILQAAEKKPISRKAIAGLYFYKQAKEFVDAAKRTILNCSTQTGYYLSNTINEFVLNGQLVKSLEIPKERYFHFYDSHNLEQYESSEVSFNLNLSLLNETKNYIKAFNEKDISRVADFFSEDFFLSDPEVHIHGKDQVISYIENIFESHEELSFKEKNVFVDGKYSIIEFALELDDKKLVGTDIISWGNDNKMVSMNAYLQELSQE